MLMKRAFTLIATALLLGGASLPADAVNLYFLKGSEATPVKTADAEKLVFETNSLTVNVWMVNDSEGLEEAAEAGAGFETTDNPEYATKLKAYYDSNGNR